MSIINYGSTAVNLVSNPYSGIIIAPMPDSSLIYTFVYDPDHSRIVALSTTATAKSAYSTNGGLTWNAGGVPPVSGTAIIVYDPDHDCIIGGARASNGTVTSYNGGQTWSMGGVPSPASILSFIHDPINNLILGIDISTSSNGTFYSTNGGTTWTYRSANISNRYSLRDAVFDPDHNRIVIPASANAGTITPKCKYTSNGGATYVDGGFVFGNSDIAVSGRLCYDAYNHRIISVAQVPGSVAGSPIKSSYSTDGGETWTLGANLPVTSAYRACYMPKPGFEHVVSVGAQSIPHDLAKTVDGANSWTVAASLPGLSAIYAVAVDPVFNNAAITMAANGTGVVVYTGA